MKTSTKKREEMTLEQYRVALTNAEKHEGITKALEECGYDSKTIGRGWELLYETKAIVEKCVRHRDLEIAAHNDFCTKMDALNKCYLRDRTKAKLVYRNDPEKRQMLGLSQPGSKAYIYRIETIRKFYNDIMEDKTIQKELSRLNFTLFHIKEGQSKIAEVETSRAAYINIKGESQDFTEARNGSIKKMKDWMKEFYGVAKLGLGEQPQLMEALGKVVR